MSFQDLYKQQRYLDCEKLCRETLTREKGNLDAYMFLIKSLENLGELTAAVKECDLAIKLCHDTSHQAEFLHLKSVLLVKSSELKKATQSYRAALQKDPERAATWLLLASCQFELNQFKDCEKSVVEVLKRAERLPSAAMGRALYLLSQSREH